MHVHMCIQNYYNVCLHVVDLHVCMFAIPYLALMFKYCHLTHLLVYFLQTTAEADNLKTQLRSREQGIYDLSQQLTKEKTRADAAERTCRQLQVRQFTVVHCTLHMMCTPTNRVR